MTEAFRKTELFKINATTETERDAAQTRARSLDSQTSAAKARLDELLAGTRPEQIDRVRAQLRELETQIAELRVVAPADCTLELLHIKIGDVVGPNAPLATILYPSNLWMRVYIPEPWLPRMKIGDTAQIHVESFGKKTFVGEIEQINRRAEFTPRNVQMQDERAKQVFGLKLRIPDTANLRRGMSAEVTFPAALLRTCGTTNKLADAWRQEFFTEGRKGREAGPTLGDLRVLLFTSRRWNFARRNFPEPGITTEARSHGVEKDRSPPCRVATTDPFNRRYAT